MEKTRLIGRILYSTISIEDMCNLLNCLDVRCSNSEMNLYSNDLRRYYCEPEN